MKTFSELRNLYGSLCNNTTSTNLTLGSQLINDAIRRILASFDWPFLVKSTTMSTSAGVQFYDLPFDYDRLINVDVTQGSTRYNPIQAPSQDFWDRLNMNTNVQSNIPTYFFIQSGRVGFYPIPSTTTSNAISVTYRQRVANLAVADYTTGNVSAVTNGATTVTGSGTSWTSAMAGRWISITQTDTAGQSGDGIWYQIASVASTTSLTLSKAYQGTTISGNTAYTIGQVSLLPEAHQDLPVYWAAYVYFSSVQPERNQSPLFKQMYDESFARLVRDYGMKTSNPVMDIGEEYPYFNPNLAPTNIGT